MGLEKDCKLNLHGKYEKGVRSLITDVEGVKVAHVTLQSEDHNVNTGVTAILPHSGNLFREKLFAGAAVINGFGKSVGLVQMDELGTLESPIIMTNTLSVGTALTASVKYMLEKNPETKIVAAEPKNVSALLGDEPGLHQIQGIGDGFIPDVLDTSIITDIVEVSDEDAINTARNLAKVQGLLVGTSAGANIWTAMQMAEKYGKDKVIATILPDRAERYFSTALI